MTAHLYINRLSLHPDVGVPISYDSDLGGGHLLARQHRVGDDVGAVAVRLAAGGDTTLVLADHGSSRDVTALTRAIEALTTVRAELARLTEGHTAPRRCITVGDWGRCRVSEHGQDEPHNFPTQVDWQADRAMLEGARAKVKTRA